MLAALFLLALAVTTIFLISFSKKKKINFFFLIAVSELVYLFLFLYVRLTVFVQRVVVSSYPLYNEVFMTNIVMLCREIQSWSDSRSPEN